MTQKKAAMAKLPPYQAVTLVLEFIDGTKEDWHFETPREMKNFILSVSAAKRLGYGESWMLDIFKIDIRPFIPGVN